VENKGLIAQTIVLFTIVVGFFQLADSPTFQAYVWQPIFKGSIGWSADDWNILASIVIGFVAGVWFIYLVWRGQARGALRSYWWYASSVYLILLSAYRHAKWMGWW
jgi:hypothetical protein